MFTPPPSPDPPRTIFSDSNEGGYFDIPTQDTQLNLSHVHTSAEAKRAISRRTKWAVIIVPLLLVLITGATRYFTHPALFDVLSGQGDLDVWSAPLAGWLLGLCGILPPLG